MLICRLVALPLVCKQWARILGQPSAVWDSGVVDLQALYDLEDDDSDREVDYALDRLRVDAWFRR